MMWRMKFETGAAAGAFLSLLMMGRDVAGVPGTPWNGYFSVRRA